jgi:hypothetical protein
MSDPMHHPTTIERSAHAAYKRRLAASGVIPRSRVTLDVLLDLLYASEEMYRRSFRAIDLKHDHHRVRAKLLEAIARYRTENEYGRCPEHGIVPLDDVATWEPEVLEGPTGNCAICHSTVLVMQDGA